MKWASFFHTGLKTHFKFLQITEGIFFFTSLFVNGHMLYFSLWSGCTQMDISIQMHAPLHVDAYIHVYVQFTSSNMYVLHGRLDKFTLKIKFSFQFSFSYTYIYFFFYCGGEKMLIFILALFYKLNVMMLMQNSNFFVANRAQCTAT